MFASQPGLGADNPQCDRACLREMMEDYLQAVAENDPESVPLMIGFRQTDNAIATRPGTGVWRSVTAVGTVQRYYLDPVNSQAAFFGTVEEGAQAVVVTVRIKVQDGELSEAEWYIGRPNDPGMLGPPTEDGTVRPGPFNVDYFIANPPPAEAIVPLQDRLSRASLEGLANSYFDALSNHNGSLAYVHPDCSRIENGQLITGRALPEGSTDGFEGKSNCVTNFQLDGPLSIAAVTARRYPVIDEEQQVIMGDVVFRRLPNAVHRRLALSELFYLDNKLITSIYAAMFYADPNIPLPNWAPFDGNFPLPESFGITK
tara:strand:- start:741 stop:1685 length:945 start_codon:yes stop_codon:yes gene_type:complete